jgi:ribosomal protein S18 acetylase RimI-like enzyme
MTIQPLASEHLDDVVRLHLDAFPSFFLCFLGPRFLREFYKSFIRDSQGLAYVAVAKGRRILGVVVGPLDPRDYFRRLVKRRWWAFGLASLGYVLRRPSDAPRVFRALYYRGETPPGPVRALLSSLAVQPAAQGCGVGRMLALRWTQEARRRGAPGCYLTTDADDNDKVNAFYRALDWKLEHTYTTPEGRRMNRYVLDFSPAPAEAKASFTAGARRQAHA